MAVDPSAWTLAALDLLFPALCPVCGATLGPGRHDPLCGVCWERVERIGPPQCERCGIPFGAGRGLCHGCRTDPPAFAYACAAGAYTDPLREALLALKYRGRRTLARPLAELTVEQCRSALPADIDAVVPVPLARARERERGFNQAALIGERVARGLTVPIRRAWLARVRATAPQSDLTAAERRANVRHAFAATAAVAGRHVLIVDDVMTTGATADDCARALYAAGARRVGVLSVARVLPPAV